MSDSRFKTREEYERWKAAGMPPLDSRTELSASQARSGGLLARWRNLPWWGKALIIIGLLFIVETLLPNSFDRRTEDERVRAMMAMVVERQQALEENRRGCEYGAGRWGGLYRGEWEGKGAPEIGESEDVLLAWIDCLGRVPHPVFRDRPATSKLRAVNETKTARGIHRQYVLSFGWYYYTDNGIITAIQR